LYDYHVKGAQIRSRAEWVEKGERSNKYFLGLEKHRQSHNVIKQVKKSNGQLTSSDSDILLEITEYYSRLYKSENVNEKEINEYVSNCNTKQLSENDKELCEQEITLDEICNAIDSVKENKSPGLDGITPEFYKAFKNDIVQPLYEMIIETYNEGELPDSLKKAVVTLIYKKGDHCNLENYRPISLTNYDYKILAFVLAKRMQNVISSIIDENQTAYIKKRYIGTNARLIQDIFEYCENENVPGILLGLDFAKAFDVLEWPFMLNTLKKFNFGNNFIKWITILYTKPGLSFKNNGWMSSEVRPTRGIRQGCPISALLFILSAEILAQYIRDNEHISGIYVNNTEHKISQYADDSYLFLSDINSVTQSIDTIRKFSMLAGPKLNMKKTEGILLGPYKNLLHNICEINFTDNPVRCFGIYVGHDKAKCFEKNWVEKLKKIENILEIWKKRQLTIFGKVTIIKTIIMSKLVYNFSLLSTPDGIEAMIDKLLYKFIWNNKERIKRNTLIAEVEDGGISMVDTMSKNMSTKASWVKRLLEGGSWCDVFKWYLNLNNVDLDYLIKMNVKKQNECDMYKQLPQFYREVLLSFNACKTVKPIQRMNTHDFLSSPIMGNDLIRTKGKCVFYKSWLESGIKYVKDLYNEKGIFMGENMLLEKLKNKTNWIIEYASLKKAVRKYECMFDTDMSPYTNVKDLRYIMCGNKLHEISELTSKDFYNMLIRKKITRSHMESVFSKEFDVLNHIDFWNDIYLRKVKVFPVKKIAEFNFKILHNTFYSGYMVNRWNKACSANCKYCGILETPKHLLFECKRIKALWEKVGRILKINIAWKHIVIGVNDTNTNSQIINMCISIVAYSINCLWIKCSMSNTPYENVKMMEHIESSLLFYSRVLKNTKAHNKIGEILLHLFV